MANQTVRIVVTVAVVAALWLAMPVESQACEFLERLFGCNCGSAKSTYVPAYVAPSAYAPAYAPSCAPCAAPCASCAPQTCQYVPQTCYRTVYQPVPVTTCQATPCCDPCTGCPMTAYYPTTTWTYQARLIPYTTYRIVYSNPCSPCAGYSYSPCASCGPTGYFSSGAPCSSCVGGTTAAGTVPYTSAGTPLEVTPSPSLPPGSGGTSAPGNGGTRRTYESERKPANDVQPVPDPATENQNHLNSTPAGPKLIDSHDRTAFRTTRSGAEFRPSSSAAPLVPVEQPALNDGGWRAARD